MSEQERRIIALIDPARDWTTVSIAALVDAAPRQRLALFRAVASLLRDYQGLVDLCATSEAMAASGSRSRRWHLRRYYRHSDGRWISHLALHRDILRVEREGGMSEFRWECDGDKFFAVGGRGGCVMLLECRTAPCSGWKWSATVTMYSMLPEIAVRMTDWHESLAAAQGAAEMCVPGLVAGVVVLAKSMAERQEQESERC